MGKHATEPAPSEAARVMRKRRADKAAKKAAYLLGMEYAEQVKKHGEVFKAVFSMFL